MSISLNTLALFPRAEDGIQCETQRGPDYYGLGVRMGIYFAWFQAYIANVALPSEIPSALDTNAIFLLTILVAMIKCSSSQMFDSMDALILMHLAGGTVFGILSMWGYRTRQYFDDGPRAVRFFGGFGTHARLIISLGVSIFGLWFWMFGVVGGLPAMGLHDDVETPNSPECSTLYTFMFASVRADGGVRFWYIFVCVCCTVYFGVMLLASSLAGWARVRRMAQLAREQRWSETSRLRYATGFKYRETAIIFKALRVLNLIWLVYSIFLVEFTLNYNHMNAVLGGPNQNEVHLPAQLLPLLIGSFGFVRICYLTFEQWRAPGQLEPSVAGPVPPSPARTMHFGKDLLQAFSPQMRRHSTSVEHHPEDIDELQRRRSRAVRYLVAWLPWLSLMKYFHDEPSMEVHKRISRRYDDEENLRRRPTEHEKAARHESIGGSTVHDRDSRDGDSVDLPRK